VTRCSTIDVTPHDANTRQHVMTTKESANALRPYHTRKVKPFLTK